MGEKNIVGIQRRDEAAPGAIDRGVAGFAAAAIGLGDELNARIAEGFYDRARIIPGAIVHHDDFKILAALGSHGFKRPAQARGAIVNRYDHAEEWCHQRPVKEGRLALSAAITSKSAPQTRLSLSRKSDSIT